MVSIETMLEQAACIRRRAKRLLTFTLVTAAMSQCAQAQTFAEWFSQKKTQKKYLLQQIAALQVYSGYLQKGYHIAKGGLGSISSYVGSELGMHGDYYDHLKSVSILVKNNPQVNEILRWQQDILNQARRLKNEKGLTKDESKYVGKVSKALLSDCDAQLNDLQTVLTDQKTAMSDEERFRQINRLRQAMQDNYRFVSSFRSQLQIYLRGKQQEIQNVKTLNHLYGNR